MWSSFLQALTIETMRTRNAVYTETGTYKICFRCRNEDPAISCVCLHCQRVVYCNKKCLKKNRKLHSHFCKFYVDNAKAVEIFMQNIMISHKNYMISNTKLNKRKLNDEKLGR